MILSNEILKSGNAMCLTSDRSKAPDAPAGPPPHCLRFYTAARSACEFIKKSPILIPFASSSLVAAPCGCPVLDVDVLATAALPICRRSLGPRRAPPAPYRHARWCWWCSLRTSRALSARSTQARCWWHWWHWCSHAPLVLDASGARAPPLFAGSHPDGRN